MLFDSSLDGTDNCNYTSEWDTYYRATGTHGSSEWSNVLEINDGGTQEIPEETKGEPESESVTDVKDEEK